MRRVRGVDATDADWRFFNRCYRHTYRAHHSTPYLNLDFFLRIGRTMPDNILLVIAERDGQPVASSLVIHSDDTLFGRYWGELEHVPCLHFEAAYYQPLEFCIEQKHRRVRRRRPGRAQDGARLPADPDLVGALAGASGVCRCDRALPRARSGGIDEYIDELNERNPFKDI